MDHVSEPGKADISIRELSTKLITIPLQSKNYLAEVAKLDNKLRYQLNQLAEMGLLLVSQEPHGTRHFKRYSPNPAPVICADGVTWILSDPITIINCSHHEECSGVCLEAFPNGCKTYKEAPVEIQQLINRYLTVMG